MTVRGPWYLSARAVRDYLALAGRDATDEDAFATGEDELAELVKRAHFVKGSVTWRNPEAAIRQHMRSGLGTLRRFGLVCRAGRLWVLEPREAECIPSDAPFATVPTKRQAWLTLARARGKVNP